MQNHASLKYRPAIHYPQPDDTDISGVTENYDQITTEQTMCEQCANKQTHSAVNDPNKLRRLNKNYIR